MSSDDEYTTDDQTRKRRPAGKEIGAEFSKSIKTMKTPPKAQNKEETMLDTILKTIQDMKIETEDNAGIKESMEVFIKQHLGLGVQIKEARKLGEKVCLISLESELDEIQQLSHKTKKRNTETNDKNG
ncbi:hypothetical protein ILUMI_17571 [Ignelater luminosus]|uniref:Uncharacterized protein n=1 Tax=Ignelater luminosus TaxID=2038154 RepID=A0A8K0CNT5_IGNLU|nr:hypothetical protein ILUMI_17571 [Ignelater luminosus]